MKKKLLLASFILNSIFVFAQQPSIQWQNTIGGDVGDILTSIEQTADGGYIIASHSTSYLSGDKTENNFAGSYDFWVVKLDATGNIQWQNNIGGNGFDHHCVIHQTTDGGYILGGSSESAISGDKTEVNVGGGGDSDYWVLKLNANGSIRWLLEETMQINYSHFNKMRMELIFWEEILIQEFQGIKQKPKSILVQLIIGL